MSCERRKWPKELVVQAVAAAAAAGTSTTAVTSMNWSTEDGARVAAEGIQISAIYRHPKSILFFKRLTLILKFSKNVFNSTLLFHQTLYFIILSSFFFYMHPNFNIKFKKILSIQISCRTALSSASYTMIYFISNSST